MTANTNTAKTTTAAAHTDTSDAPTAAHTAAHTDTSDAHTAAHPPAAHTGGARPDGKRRWNTLSHNGVKLPPKKSDAATATVSVRMRPGGSLVKVPPGPAANALVDYMRRGGTKASFMGKAQYARNFWKDWGELAAAAPATKAMSSPRAVGAIDLTGARVVRGTVLRPAAAADAGRYSVATVDGKRAVPISQWAVDRPGVFVGRTKYSGHTGRIRRRIGAADVTLNLGKGQRPPPAPPGERWGAIVHDPRVDWVASWRDPVTSVIKYARFAAASGGEQNASRKRFDTARDFYRTALQPLRARNSRLLRGGSDTTSLQLQTSLCMWLIVELGLRVGSGGHGGRSAAGGSYGASTLLRSHVVLVGGGVVLDFPAKDGVRYRRTLSSADHPVAVRAFRSLLGGRRAAAAGGAGPLFPGIVSSATINDEIERSTPGVTAKVVRTARASALFEATLDRLLPEKPSQSPLSPGLVKLAFTIANARVALFCNHRRAGEKQAVVDLTEYERRLDAIVDTGLASASAAVLARDVLRPAALILATSRKSYIDPRIEYAVRARLPAPSRPPLSPAALVAVWAAKTAATDAVNNRYNV